MQALRTRSAEDKKRLGRYLYYMHFLLRLFRQPVVLRAFRVRRCAPPVPAAPSAHRRCRGARQADQLAETLEVPEIVAERFMELFADETREGDRVKYARTPRFGAHGRRSVTRGPAPSAPQVHPLQGDAGQAVVLHPRARTPH